MRFKVGLAELVLPKYSVELDSHPLPITPGAVQAARRFATCAQMLSLK
jgi:hypothetical protein